MASVWVGCDGTPSSTSISFVNSCNVFSSVFSIFLYFFYIHIPEGAVPKDGPSAGITMATAVLSAVTDTPVRAKVAMTGEVTLRGRVLAIGGLKEKLLAAKMAGITTVLVPKENEKDVDEIAGEIKAGMEICFVETMDEVIEKAFVTNRRKANGNKKRKS